MFQTYELFFRNFGIRKSEQLMTPPLPSIDKLAIPRDSILHYLTASQLDYGPASTELLLREDGGRMFFMDHVHELQIKLGAPRRQGIAVEGFIRSYHLKNKRFRQLRGDPEPVARNPSTLIVENYGLLSHLYRYQRSTYTEYFQWYNEQVTLWRRVATMHDKLPNRQHFIVCKLPVTLPSLADLAVGEGDLSLALLKRFPSEESLFLLELWKWFGPNRKASLLSECNLSALRKTNLIFQESGRWFVMNLGVMESWRKATKEELAANTAANKKGLEAESMQRRFLRLMVSLMQVRTVAAPEVTEATATDAVIAKPAEVKQDPQGEVKKVETIQVNQQTGSTQVVTQTQPLEVEDAQQDAANAEGADATADDFEEEDQEFERRLNDDLKQLEVISNRRIEEEQNAEVVVDVEPNKTLEQGVMDVCDRLADSGLMSAAEYRRYGQLAGTYKTLPAPMGKPGTLDKFIEVKPEMTAIPESPAVPDARGVVDKTMLKSSLHVFDSKYIKEVMPRDVASMVLNIQNAGIAVTDYEVEKVEDILGAYEDYTVRITPVEGTSSTLRFKLPSLDEDGVYKANGIKYRLRKQRGDLPIRKISPSKVALTSYYGKLFVTRSPKRVNDYAQWICAQVMAIGLDNENMTITDLRPTRVFDPSFSCPRLYSSLAGANQATSGFAGFKLQLNVDAAFPGAKDQYELIFDHRLREKQFTADIIKSYEKEGAVIFGTNLKGEFLLMDKFDAIFIASNDKLYPLPPFETLIGADPAKAPVDFAEMRIMGRTFPLGVILGYEMGLEKLMKLLGVTPRRVAAGGRQNLTEDEYSLVFSDETLIFSRDDRKAAMILAGFNEYHSVIRNYSVYEFNRRAVYLNVLEPGGSAARYLREMDLLYRLFIDPITKELLMEMKEPTTFRGLLLRCNELLLDDQHPHELDPAFMRIKGYERMAGAVYSELVRSIRAHAARPSRRNLAIDLNPYAVWKAIAQDPSIQLVNDINPIQNLKEIEAVTYSGTGGRNSRSMTKNTRAYHENDMGTISESTVDSFEVGVNIYLSADPQFTSVRGMSKRYEIGKTGATALFSTSALISPAADKDDPKRVNFIGVQHSHGVACKGYTQMPVRTGYEKVIAHRTTDLFAFTAKQDGKVISRTDTALVVEFKDGSKKSIELGRRFGKSAGLVIPHQVESDLKEGQTFKAGKLLCYNSGFFERDILDPNNVVWKAGVLVRTVLMESTQTLEDSSAISKEVAELLTTNSTKVKTVVVSFDQSVRKMVKEGDKVEAEDILCIIENAVTAENELFDEDSLDTLRIVSGQTPLAKTKGVVERVEVYYHGEKQDMSESLRAIANASDREFAKRSRALGKKEFSGSVDEGFRIEGDPLPLDTMAIQFYITTEVSAGVGDKGVFGNQMKTVFGEVLPGPITTESGKPVHAVFGMKSVADRIVLSPELMGTTAVLLDVIGEHAVRIYES